VRDILSPSTLGRRGLFNVAFVERLLLEHEAGFADHGSLIWGLLNVELWYRRFIDMPTRTHSPSHSATAGSAQLGRGD